MKSKPLEFCPPPNCEHLIPLSHTWGCFGVLWGVWGHPKTLQGASRCFKVLQGTPGCPKAPQGAPRHPKTLQGASTRSSASRCLDMPQKAPLWCFGGALGDAWRYFEENISEKTFQEDIWRHLWALGGAQKCLRALSNALALHPAPMAAQSDTLSVLRPGPVSRSAKT